MFHFIFSNYIKIGVAWFLINAAFSIVSSFSTVKSESTEHHYVINSHSFLRDIASKRIDLECAESTPASSENKLSVSEVYNKGNDAFFRCATEVIPIALNVTTMLGEAIYTPVGASIPIAGHKAYLSDDNDKKDNRCSHQVNTLISACPSVAKRYITSQEIMKM
jgi:hypothetical protein